MNAKSIWTSISLVALALLLFAGLLPKRFFQDQPVVPTNANSSGKAELAEAYGKLPLCFEANQGQTDEQVEFMARGNGYALFLTTQEAVFSLQKPVGGEQLSVFSEQLSIAAPKKSEMVATTSDEPRAASVIRLELAGANPAPRIQGLEQLPGKINQLKGNDPTHWRTNVATYAKIKYHAIYPGVDLVYYGNQQELEYDFIVAPGADPAAIKLGFAGVDKLEVDSQGDLVMHVADAQVRMHKPIIYQEQEGIRQEISGGYKLLVSAADDDEGNGLPHAGFHVEAYDMSAPLVIDPILIYSTFLGGSDQDISNAIAVDGAGSAYITGFTSSLDFPVANALQPVCVCLDQDIFVTKLNPSGTALVYSTYLGGTRRENGFDLVVDAAGNAYVSGWAQSSDFPLMNPAQPAFGGGDVDAIVFKLNPAGSALVFSTFLGGSGTVDYGNAIFADATGNVHVAGVTDSPNFPTVNAQQPLYAGGATDAFVTKFNATGSTLVYSSYLGGNGRDSAQGIFVDDAGNAYLTGVTDSPDFPVANALQPTWAGLQDVFITKLNPSTAALAYSTFLGGSADDIGTDIARDASGNLYVTGQTASPDFPTANALQPALAGSRDAMVVKLNATASALVYSTFLGGSLDDYARDLAVDGTGSVYVAGWTLSSDFPTVNPMQSTFAGGVYDGILAKLNPAGSALVYATYFGGTAEDRPTGLAVDVHGAAYMTGLTFSTDLPTLNAFQATPHGQRDVFVMKVTDAAVCKPFVFLANKVTLKRTKQHTPAGDIHSNGTLLVEKGDPSTYNSNLTAVGALTIQKDNTINGNVKSSLAVSNAGTVNGVISVGPVATEPLPSKSYSAGGLNQTVPQNGALALAPGSYGIVTLNSGGTLQLTSGEYFINEVRYPGSTAAIAIDLASGAPVNINVVSNLQLGKEVEIRLLPNGESDSELVTFFTLQSTAVSIGKEAYFLGTLNAPNATVTLLKNSQLRGSICAKEIVVERDCLFLHHDSPGTLPGPGNLPKASESEALAFHGDQTDAAGYGLLQNYPNPFNPTTRIGFKLQKAEHVALVIYTLAGQSVRELVSGEMAAGQHSFVWDARDDQGLPMASGVYLCVLRSASFSAQTKLLLMR
ncbi:MAG: hypothetical protein DKINENOH_04393 [bacterium]|nr:hypothetical protein [bacterium]